MELTVVIPCLNEAETVATVSPKPCGSLSSMESTAKWWLPTTAARTVADNSRLMQALGWSLSETGATEMRLLAVYWLPVANT